MRKKNSQKPEIYCLVLPVLLHIPYFPRQDRSTLKPWRYNVQDLSKLGRSYIQDDPQEIKVPGKTLKWDQ